MTRAVATIGNHTESELLELIEREDASLQKIADAWGVTKCQLQRWIDADPQRAQRARQAREAAAELCEQMAEQALLDLRPGASQAEIVRARELSQYYRWRARIRNPARYGEKVTVSHNHTVDPRMMSDAELLAIAAQGGLTIEGEAQAVDD